LQLEQVMFTSKIALYKGVAKYTEVFLGRSVFSVCSPDLCLRIA